MSERNDPNVAVQIGRLAEQHARIANVLMNTLQASDILDDTPPNITDAVLILSEKIDRLTDLLTDAVRAR